MRDKNMVTAERRDLVTCDLCGKVDEGIAFKKKILWIFPVEIEVCEGCISRLFKKFRKRK